MEKVFKKSSPARMPLLDLKEPDESSDAAQKSLFKSEILW
jgi:hypothetical protein